MADLFLLIKIFAYTVTYMDLRFTVCAYCHAETNRMKGSGGLTMAQPSFAVLALVSLCLQLFGFGLYRHNT